ncbi:MAG: OmpA family protein [Natronospirillum sp.]|uniref:OmpA family protein n=1 Tax=Natronospirillum sp. TaxID=2812955 RepID=UPI0025D94331|nr:OmpA family protein [Natronospirillum sp.]MCH8551874.1 OmpA family protein [Natronospirillum sp.]
MITAKVFAILMTLLALILGGLSGYQYFQSTERDETVAALRGDVADLTRSNRDLENELTRVRSERDQLAAQAEDLESDHSAAADTAAELNARLTEITAERDDLDSSLIEMTTARDELRAELRQQQEETAELAAELAAAQDALATAESERDDVVAERDTLQDELAAAQSERDDLAAERDSLQDELANAQSERDDAITERDSLQDELAAGQTELERTRAQLSGREETMEELETRLEREQSALDELQGRLNLAEVERQQLIEQRQDGQTLIQLPERILFGTGSAGLSDDAVDALREVALAVESFPDYTLSVIGHSDSRAIGPTLQSVYPTNWELSAARASATVRALADLGISEDRMKATGVAATQPLVEEVDDASRQQNRRIEIILEPPLQVQNLQEASRQ